MSRDYYPKILFPFICFCVFVSAAFAQKAKPQALKFDEFTINAFDSLTLYFQPELKDRVKRFGEELNRQPTGSRAVVIYYTARVSDEESTSSLVRRLNNMKNDYSELNNRFPFENIVISNGGFRENYTVEFWIVPPNGEQPEAAPTFSPGQAVVCPRVRIYQESLIDALGQTAKVRFYVADEALKNIKDYTLKWTVVGGNIIGGQNSPQLEVEPSGADAKQAAAYLEVTGLPFPCQQIFSQTAEFTRGLRLIDEFGVLANGDVKARTDYFWIEMNNNPQAKGYIVTYGSRSENGKDKARRSKQLADAIRFRRLDLSRVTFVDGGFREDLTTEFWLAFGDAVPPLTPTVDAKFVRLPVKAAAPRRRK